MVQYLQEWNPHCSQGDPVPVSASPIRYPPDARFRTNTIPSVSHRLLSFLLLALFLFCPPTWAQSTDSGSLPPPSSSSDSSSSTSTQTQEITLTRSQLSLWLGGSLESGHLLGKIPRSRFALLGIRYHHLLIPAEASPLAPSRLTLTYTADVFPLAHLSIPPHTISTSPRRGENNQLWEKGLQTNGIGASPFGLRINHRYTKHIQPFIAGSSGFIYFFRPMPDERGRHLNFTIDVGLGVQVLLSSSTTLTLGYRYLHLSNGFRGIVNPGVDANLMHLGVTVLP